MEQQPLGATASAPLPVGDAQRLHRVVCTGSGWEHRARRLRLTTNAGSAKRIEGPMMDDTRMHAAEIEAQHENVATLLITATTGDDK